MKNENFNLLGLVFGKLTVMGLDEEKSKLKKEKFWLCKCECGNEKIIRGADLKRGMTRSCGCLYKDSARRRSIDLTGQKFGRWTVISLDDEFNGIYGKIYWLCRCSCGIEKVILSENLLSGDTKSCGCLRKELYQLPFGEASFNALYSYYKGAPKRRGVEFSLDKECFKILTQSNCYYCGKLPSQIKKTQCHNGDYIYNGVDRIDSSKGYVEGNVVPCCGRCNEAKMAESQEGFIEWIKMTYLNLKEKGVINTNE